MTVLYAQPYDISVHGFFFETEEEYMQNASKNLNQMGFPVEEYEIQFIEGEEIDAQLFRALKIQQNELPYFLTICDEWDEHQKQKVIIAVGECGYDFDFQNATPDDFEVVIYEMNNMRELAEYFVKEGIIGEIPECLRNYIDYEAIARDLSFDYSEIIIAGKKLIYCCQ